LGGRKARNAEPVDPAIRTTQFDLIRGGHYGQRPRVPHTQAEHMDAPTNAANVKKVLANSEPSTHWGKADIAIAPQMLDPGH
jgi:hypothetical protein